MNKNLLIILFILISVVTVFYIDYNIKKFNVDFYQGKDGGFFIRFESIFVISMFLFVFSQSKRKLLMAIIGGFTGIFSSILSYFLWFTLFDDLGLSFHILALVLVLISFIIVKKFFVKS